MESFEPILPSHVVKKALYNSLEISERVEDYDIFGSTRFPEMSLPEEFQGRPEVIVVSLDSEDITE